MIKLEDLPKLPQRQDSVADQLSDLHSVANRLGMYDAADAIKQKFGDGMKNALNIVKYGCHADLDDGMEPDGCVMDSNEHHLCIYAKHGMRKEQCEYWKIVK